LGELRPEVPAEVASIVQRMMAKDPTHRYQTPAEVVEALTPLSKAVPTPTASTGSAHQALATTPERIPSIPLPATRPRSWKRPVVWASLAALVALGAAFLPRAFRGPAPVTQNQGAESNRASTPGAGKTSNETTVAGAPTGRVLLVLPSRDFWYMDYEPVRQTLSKSGIKVQVASSQPLARYDRGGKGEDVTPDLLLRDVKPEDFDAVVFIGGQGAQEYKVDTEVGRGARDLINTMLKQDKYVAALCMAPGVLSHWGALRGHEATCFAGAGGFQNLPKILETEGKATFVNKPVVVSGKIITGRDPQSATAFAEELLRQLRKK
jgi:protease I